MRVTLRLVGEGTFREINLIPQQTVVIGRSSRCDVPVQDLSTSGVHIKITLNDDSLELHDQASKNGTFLNGMKVESSQVFIGDKITIGNTIITIAEEKCDENARNFLSVPGKMRDRAGNALKLDFTGARIQNQSLSSGLAAQNQNVNETIRRLAQSSNKISKEELKKIHQKTTSIALIMDIMFILMILPFTHFGIIMFAPDALTDENRQYVTYAFQFALITWYYIYNYKVSDFTIGEKLAGLEKIYDKQ